MRRGGVGHGIHGGPGVENMPTDPRQMSEILSASLFWQKLIRKGVNHAGMFRSFLR